MTRAKVLGALVLAGCAAQTVRQTPEVIAPAPARITAVPTLVSASPAEAGMRSDLNALLDSLMTVGISEGAAPGGSLAVGRYGKIVHMKGYGRLDTLQTSALVDENSIYDMASLTKVIATTTAAMILEEAGQLDLDRTVASYLPEFNAPDKAAITVRMLNIHQGGLEAFAALYRDTKGREEYLTKINSRPVTSQPGTKTVYSDWDLILMQLIIERITGQTLDRFTAERIFTPLGMTSTMYNPDSATYRHRIAPTEIDSVRGGLVVGKVHDDGHVLHAPHRGADGRLDGAQDEARVSRHGVLRPLRLRRRRDRQQRRRRPYPSVPHQHLFRVATGCVSSACPSGRARAAARSCRRSAPPPAQTPATAR